MIDSMKQIKTDGLEKAQDESRSQEFESLFMEHWAQVYRLLQRLVGDPSEAEDLTLETFLRLYKDGRRHEAGFNLGGWLHRHTCFVAANVMRGDREKSLEAGCDGYIQKPIDIDTLGQQIERFTTRSNNV
jgi:DNA-directed RNA polymerase specialized sigma24 family protein